MTANCQHLWVPACVSPFVGRKVIWTHRCWRLAVIWVFVIVLCDFSLACRGISFETERNSSARHENSPNENCPRGDISSSTGRPQCCSSSGRPSWTSALPARVSSWVKLCSMFASAGGNQDCSGACPAHALQVLSGENDYEENDILQQLARHSCEEVFTCEDKAI